MSVKAKRGAPLPQSVFLLEERAAADAAQGPEHGWYVDDLEGSDVLEDAAAQAQVWADFNYEEGDMEARVVEYTRRRVVRIAKKRDPKKRKG